MLSLTVSEFEADPDRVTELLGIEPTRVSRKGHVGGRSGRPWRRNDWSYEVEAHLTNSETHDAALNCILRQLHGREERFAALRELIKPRHVIISGGFYIHPDEQCGILLDPDQMRLIAACGVAWGLDFYVRGPSE